MHRGSKPGERRGGRQRGTPNKSTLLKNAAFKAAATDPNLSPLDFLLGLMRQGDLPLELRVTVAHQALPLAHRKPKPTYGRSGTGVNEKIGPRVKVVKVNSDDANAHSVTPLDFLLGVMRDANGPPALRLRAAGMVAPYVHPKGEPTQIDEAQSEMTVVDDPYGFDADIADAHKSIEQAQERLNSSLQAIPCPAWGNRQRADRQEFGRFLAACEKANLEFQKSIAEKQAALKCPPNYKELDSRRDRSRLKELETEGKTRPLTAAEGHEQKHLHARLAAYALTPESAECAEMNLLKATRADLRTPKEQEELKRLEARYPEVPLDLTLIERHVLLARESLAQCLRAREADLIRRSADNGFRDQEQRGP
jgi:hypothetical protein